MPHPVAIYSLKELNVFRINFVREKHTHNYAKAPPFIMGGMGPCC